MQQDRRGETMRLERKKCPRELARASVPALTAAVVYCAIKHESMLRARGRTHWS
jgi:hypothetical protein